jgi:uncharacterized protein YciU (UPF0263 family)
MAAKEKYVRIARGGYLKYPILERFTISEDDEEFDDEFENFNEYRAYILEEMTAEMEQVFAKVLIMTEEEFNLIKTL